MHCTAGLLCVMPETIVLSLWPVGFRKPCATLQLAQYFVSDVTARFVRPQVEADEATCFYDAL